MPKLYDVPLSPFGQKVKIALNEKGVEYGLMPAELGVEDPEFSASSPRQEVPALVDGDLSVFDSTIILAYVEERWPEPRLLPPDPAGRARARMIEEICDSQIEAVTWGMTEIIAFRRAEGETAARILEAGARDMATLLAWLGRQLEGREWLNGAEFGYADLAAFPVVNVAALYKIGPKPRTPLAEWLGRCRARPSVARVIEEAKAGMGTFKALVAAVSSGERKRQYRDHRLEWLIRAGGLDIVTKGLDAGSVHFSRLPE